MRVGLGRGRDGDPLRPSCSPPKLTVLARFSGPRVIVSAEDILDLVEESVIVRDLTGRVVGWNSASASLYGWSRGEASGQIAHDLLRTSHPLSVPELERRFLKAGHWDGELIRTTQSGAEVLIDTRWRVRRNADGTLLDIVETGRSLSALSQEQLEARRAEHRYRNLFQAMAASFWDLDFGEVRRMLEGLHIQGVTDWPGYFAAHPDFLPRAIASVIVLDVNDKTLGMFGAASREDMVGKSIAPYWPADQVHVFAQSLFAAVQAAPHFMTEMALNTLDGRRIDVLFTVVWPAPRPLMSIVSSVPAVAPETVAANRLARLRRRDPTADGEFWCSVVTTRVYCRPNCPSRQANAENIRFHDTLSEARATGFKACGRCLPEGRSPLERQRALVRDACQILVTSAAPPSSKDLAAALGTSASHLHRTFSRIMGMPPLVWLNATSGDPDSGREARTIAVEECP